MALNTTTHCHTFVLACGSSCDDAGVGAVRGDGRTEWYMQLCDHVMSYWRVCHDKPFSTRGLFGVTKSLYERVPIEYRTSEYDD